MYNAPQGDPLGRGLRRTIYRQEGTNWLVARRSREAAKQEAATTTTFSNYFPLLLPGSTGK
jgi:hypothetical protein